MNVLSLPPSLLLAGLTYLTMLIALMLLLMYLSPKGTEPITQVLDTLRRILYGRDRGHNKLRKCSKCRQLSKK